MGLALSLRRLDLIEMLFLSSRAPQQGTSKSTRPAHDEGLLRYVLTEVISGASGSDTISPEFRNEVSPLLPSLRNEAAQDRMPGSGTMILVGWFGRH